MAYRVKIYGVMATVESSAEASAIRQIADIMAELAPPDTSIDRARTMAACMTNELLRSYLAEAWRPELPLVKEGEWRSMAPKVAKFARKMAKVKHGEIRKTS